MEPSLSSMSAMQREVRGRGPEPMKAKDCGVVEDMEKRA